MLSFNQIQSQIRQVCLFYRFFSPAKLLLHTVSFPFNYYNQNLRVPFPLAVNFLITSECNLKCEMCTFKPMVGTTQGADLQTDDIRKFIEREHKKKFHVFLSGGEPFLRKDILEIITIIKKFKLVCGICTNGVLLNEHVIRELVRLDLDYIIFSVHGPESVHDMITGVAGSFPTLMDNISLFMKYRRRTKVLVNCAVTHSNIRYLRSVIDIVSGFGIDALRFEHTNFLLSDELRRHQDVSGRYFPRDIIGLSTHFTDGKECDWEQYHRSIYETITYARKSPVAVSFKPYLSPDEIKSWYSAQYSIQRRCIFIWKALFIDPEGNVLPCQFHIYKMGNIKTQCLDEIWNSQKYRRFRQILRKGLLPGCSRCCKI